MRTDRGRFGAKHDSERLVHPLGDRRTREVEPCPRKPVPDLGLLSRGSQAWWHSGQAAVGVVDRPPRIHSAAILPPNARHTQPTSLAQIITTNTLTTPLLLTLVIL